MTAPSSVDPNRAPIFVIGTGRSGTTLLRLMLSAHPRIYLTHEASFYVWDALIPRKKSGTEALRHYLSTFSFRWLGVDPREALRDIDRDLPRERLHEAFSAIMRAKAASYGRVRFGDKTPSHAANLAEIFRDYPDARVLHITRDPRGTVRSLSRMPWASDSVWANAALCNMERKQVAPFRDRVHELRLEDLLADPRGVMERVLEFVDEPWDEAVLDHANHVPDENDMPPVPWFSRAKRKPGRPTVDWRSTDPVELRAIEWLTRRYMRDYGYEKAVLDREPSKLAVSRYLAAKVPAAMKFAGRFVRLGLLYRNPDNFGSQEIVERLLRLNPEAWQHYPDLEVPTTPPLPDDWDRLAA